MIRWTICILLLLLLLLPMLGCERKVAWPGKPPEQLKSKGTRQPVSRRPSAARGRRAYQRQCAACHGLDGRGDGPNAAYLPRKPPALDYPGTLVERLMRPGPRMHVERDRLKLADIALYLASGLRVQHPDLRLSGADKPGCDKCHNRSGPRIIREANCAGCHRIPGMRRRRVGPDLAGVGSRFTPGFLQRYLRRPYNRRQLGYLPMQMTRMPDFRLTEQEIADLAAVLGTQRIVLPTPFPARPELAALGKRIVERKGCRDCHRIGKFGGRFGPDLTGVGKRLQWPYLVAWLRDPKALSPRTPMPRPNLDPAELQAVASYLGTLRAASMDDHRADSLAARQTKRGQPAEGRKLLLRLRCAACHAIPGIQAPRKKVPLPLQAMRDDPDWLYAYLDRPARRGEHGRMPRFRFTAPERMVLVDALMRLVKK